MNSFTLILDTPPENLETLANALYLTGCGDALCGSFQGHVFVDFNRQGEPLEVITKAIRDIQAVGAEVVRIDDPRSKGGRSA